MIDFDTYISITPDVESFEDDLSSIELTRQLDWYHTQDMFVSSIGTKDCKSNYYLFYDKLNKQLNIDQFDDFYIRCIKKFIEVYKLDTLSDLLLNDYRLFNNREVLKYFFDFLETDNYIHVFSMCIPKPENVYLLMTKDMSLYLKEHYKEIMTNISKFKNNIPIFIYDHFENASKSNFVDTLDILIEKNPMAFISSMTESK